jgi:hypothetical protein
VRRRQLSLADKPAQSFGATQATQSGGGKGHRLDSRVRQSQSGNWTGNIARRSSLGFWVLTDSLLGCAIVGGPKLNDTIDKTPANVNVLLGRLVDNGVLYRLRKGEYDYTAPRFRDYLLRRTRADAAAPHDPAVGRTLF